MGAGEDECAFQPPPTVTVLGPVGRAKTNTELVTGRAWGQLEECQGSGFGARTPLGSPPPGEGLR